MSGYCLSMWHFGIALCSWDKTSPASSSAQLENRAELVQQSLVIAQSWHQHVMAILDKFEG